MDLNNFLGRLDESSAKKVLTEADSKTGEQLKGELGNKWAYIPEKEYGGFKHVVVEEGEDKWTIYYLDRVGKEAAAGDDDESWDNLDALASQKQDEERLRRFVENGMTLNEEIEGDKSADLGEYIVQRKESGSFAEILEKCVAIVEKG